MPKNKKKLKGVTFQLVHRSQQDPLVADETAPQHVLVPLTQKETKAEKEKRIEEQHKYGIYFDDDFNYLQHLKERSDNVVEWPEHVEAELKKREEKKKSNIALPSSVFASEVEEEVGMLGKAAPISGPQLHLDPELVAAMDDDFDYNDPENQLEDNFMELAQGVASDDEFNEQDEDDYLDSDFDGEEIDEVGSLGSDMSFSKEETKSRFTNYSMTSSVIRRNNQLTLLDDRFEKMYEEYDDTEIGALDTEEIEGHVLENSDLLLQCATEFEKEQAREHLDNEKLSQKIKERLEKLQESDSEGEVQYVEINEPEKWDCETILSTYSNLYNHPKIIKEPRNNKIKVDSRTGIPRNVIGENKLTAKALNQLDQQYTGVQGPKSVGGQSIISQLSTLSLRPKDESPEDRKERKKALKEYRKERRLEKKLNSEAFKEEAKRQVKIRINNRNNVQGNRIL
ncbi:protein LTV1 homolog [Anthonomus grandis grandis]|uniref:protein LTV1 homolog n=1 Tax=Anthonomus grandis grandis TaxID=2921223 RepID=UPI0021664E70|nr:protein LTV1 homolog [Anthonomus grandis grandis]